MAIVIFFLLLVSRCLDITILATAHAKRASGRGRAKPVPLLGAYNIYLLVYVADANQYLQGTTL
ncbi:MAG TPA: hypothetical protein VFY81_12300 [Gammaproteobacteria bacterium]|nr:hypothetical protein [Gammaproteobacteria bacterium]